MSKTTGVVDFPNVMSKFIMFGMPLSQIIACATVNAARVFPSFDDRGMRARRADRQATHGLSCGSPCLDFTRVILFMGAPLFLTPFQSITSERFVKKFM